MKTAPDILGWALGYCYSQNHGGKDDPHDSATAERLALAMRVLEIAESVLREGSVSLDTAELKQLLLEAKKDTDV